MKKFPAVFILEKISLDGLDIKNYRGRGYDIGANMACIYHRVQAYANRLNEFAIYILCVTHSLKLIGLHASQKS